MLSFLYKAKLNSTNLNIVRYKINTIMQCILKYFRSSFCCENAILSKAPKLDDHHWDMVSIKQTHSAINMQYPVIQINKTQENSAQTVCV